MPDFDHATIAPLVARTDVSGYSVNVVFRCPVSHKEVTACGRVSDDQRSEVGKAVKRSLWSNLRWSIMRVFRNLFGYGVVADVGGAVADGAMSGSHSHQPSERQVKAAVVEAFRSVQQQFAWDGAGKRFVAVEVFRELQTEFAAVVQANAIDKPWDRAILARMIVEVAAVDGKIVDAERAFFQGFVGDGPGLDELAAKPPLSQAELAGVTAGEVRFAMVLWALAAAMTDENGYQPAERDRVIQFAVGFGIPGERFGAAERMAADYVVDQALEYAYADGRLDDAERRNVDVVAGRLGVELARVQRLDVACRKRKGLV